MLMTVKEIREHYGISDGIARSILDGSLFARFETSQKIRRWVRFYDINETSEQLLQEQIQLRLKNCKNRGKKNGITSRESI